MKKLITILICLMLFLLFSIATYAEKDRFGQEPIKHLTLWGISQQELKQIEKQKLSSEDSDYITYIHWINNDNCCYIKYSFKNNQLYRSFYDYDFGSIRDNFDFFKTQKDFFLAIYGNPVTDKPNFIKWESETLRVTLSINTLYKPTISISYEQIDNPQTLSNQAI